MKNFKEKFGDNLRTNVNLASYSWFNLGGPAQYFYKAKDKNQLLEFLEEAKKEKLNITIIGAGSNILFRDKGVKGVVIKLGTDFSFVKLENKNIIHTGAATLDRKVSNFAKENNLSNLEFLSCIPGSIGGAIIMNSGCYEDDISKILISIRVLNKHSLKEEEINKEDIKFLYRDTNLNKNFIVLSAKLKGITSEQKFIEKKQSLLVEKKKKSQPNQIKTCGSTFKNTSKGKKAWMLIKESGCHNFSEGNASISEKHCNFFVNNGKATSKEIETLIEKVRNRVLEKTGENLELEIKIVGE